MLYCPNLKKLDVTDLDDFDGEEDDDGVDLFPDGRDYDARDEDGP